MAAERDWRLRNQEDYLKGVTLVLSQANPEGFAWTGG
jgi:hypothetical protein